MPIDDGPRQRYDQLDNESARIMHAVPDRGSVTPEQLAVRTGLPLRIVLQRLPLLELADLVHRYDGGVALARGGGQVDAVLADLVSAYCAANLGQPLKPYEIVRGITAATGRHLGTAAVLNCSAPDVHRPPRPSRRSTDRVHLPDGQLAGRRRPHPQP